MKHLKEHIMGAIKTDQVRMRSRLFFLTHTALWLIAILLSFAVALFLLSFAIFMLRGNGLLAAPSLGMHGILPLLFSLPWLIGLAIMMLIATIEILGMHFAVVYRRPVLYSALAVLSITIVGASLVAHTTLHERMFRMGREGKLPPLGARFYEGALHERPDIHVGEIIEIGERFVIETRTGSTTVIIMNKETRRPPSLSIGDTVVVFGELVDGSIAAFGIRPLNKERVLFPKRGFKGLPSLETSTR